MSTIAPLLYDDLSRTADLYSRFFGTSAPTGDSIRSSTENPCEGRPVVRPGENPDADQPAWTEASHWPLDDDEAAEAYPEIVEQVHIERGTR